VLDREAGRVQASFPADPSASNRDSRLVEKMNPVVTTNGNHKQGRPLARRPRVLISAYSCFPNHGSEPGIGWSRATELARYCDVWVLTEKDGNQPHIAAYLEKHGPIANLQFVYVSHRSWELAVYEKPLLKYVAYRRWLRRAFDVAEQLHRQVAFDIAHHVTFSGFREPSYLYKLGIPFVWGPVGGVCVYPWRFLAGAGLSGAWFEAMRSALNVIQLNESPRVRAAAKSSSAIFSANQENKRKLQKALGVNSIVLCDVGVNPIKDVSVEQRTRSTPLRILWSGVQDTRKALELLLEASALLPSDVSYELRVLGEGRRRRQWERLADRKGIAQSVRWYGRISQEESLQQLRWADVFAFTSLRDTTGTVVLEALASGKPVVCLDHQGAGEIVTPECGIKIPVTNRRNVHRGLSDAIALLHEDRALCRELGQGALRRAGKYVWSLQAKRIADEYNRILASVGSDARCDLDSSTTYANDSRHVVPTHATTVPV
jgi:glycosyltransferase involved in cell wall biosynthesis